MDEVDWDAEATIAVVAHSLLGSMTVIIGALKTVERRGDSLSDEVRLELMTSAKQQSLHVAGVLGDLARGLPPAAVELLTRPSPASGRAADARASSA
jgi:hypothetical protein